MTKEDEIQKFLEVCESSSFPYREELLDGIRSKKVIFVSFTDTEFSSKHFHDIYFVRAKILARDKSNHAQRIRTEVLIFLENLELLPDEKIKGWGFSKDETSNFAVFEGINSRSILGCILATDKTKVSEEEWQNLWYEK